MTRRPLVLLALSPIAAFAVWRSLMLNGQSPSSGLIALGVVAALIAVVALRGRGVIGDRARFMAELHDKGAVEVTHGMARSSSIGVGGTPRNLPLVLAAFPDRLELWQLPVLGADEPTLLRSMSWTEIEAIGVGDASLNMTSGTGLVVRERTGAIVPIMIVMNAALGRRVDPAATVASFAALWQAGQHLAR